MTPSTLILTCTFPDTHPRSMLSFVSRFQWEGDVIQIVAYQLVALSADVARGSDDAFLLPTAGARRATTVRMALIAADRLGS